MKFINTKGKGSFKGLYELGLRTNDHVIVLFDNGEIKHGKIYFEEEYQTLFDAVLVVKVDYEYKTVDLTGAIGICYVEWYDSNGN